MQLNILQIYKTTIMRHLKIQIQKPTLPSLGILTQIVELNKFDMIYIYHHLSIGDSLFLERDYDRLWDRNAICVFYKGFKIGYISRTTSGIISKQLDKGEKVVAKVKALRKQKYMPLDGLDVEVYVG